MENAARIRQPSADERRYRRGGNENTRQGWADAAPRPGKRPRDRLSHGRGGTSCTHRARSNRSRFRSARVACAHCAVARERAETRRFGKSRRPFRRALVTGNRGHRVRACTQAQVAGCDRRSPATVESTGCAPGQLSAGLVTATFRGFVLPSDQMLICQISDLHVRAPGELAYRRVDTAAFVRRCVSHILAQWPLPDVVVVTGDLTDRGRPEDSFRPSCRSSRSSWISCRTCRSNTRSSP